MLSKNCDYLYLQNVRQQKVWTAGREACNDRSCLRKDRLAFENSCFRASAKIKNKKETKLKELRVLGAVYVK